MDIKLVFFIIVVAILAIHSVFVYKIRKYLKNCIVYHNIICINDGNMKNCINLKELEPFFKTYYRLFDFSYKSILTKETYDKLKSYLSKEE